MSSVPCREVRMHTWSAAKYLGDAVAVLNERNAWGDPRVGTFHLQLNRPAPGRKNILLVEGALSCPAHQPATPAMNHG